MDTSKRVSFIKCGCSDYRSDIVSDTDSHVRNALVQIYTYMRLNHRNCSIITSYEFTWFLHREICQNCHGDDVHEVLYVSDGIPFNQIDPNVPHVLQCFPYFASFATSEYVNSPTPSRRTSLRLSGTGTPGSGDNSPRTHGSTRDLPGGPSSSPGSAVGPSQGAAGHEYVTEQEFAVDDFNLTRILGFGRTKVCFDETHGVALKFGDIWKCPELLSEMQNEVDVYQVCIHSGVC